jgi:hypothetical protein
VRVDVGRHGAFFSGDPVLHFAIRLVGADGRSILTELEPHHGIDFIETSDGSIFDKQNQDFRWFGVSAPNGQTDQQFAQSVGEGITYATGMLGGHFYHLGYESSNFVYMAMSAAGSGVPARAVGGHPSPGICGGQGFDNGSNCIGP